MAPRLSEVDPIAESPELQRGRALLCRFLRRSFLPEQLERIVIERLPQGREIIGSIPPHRGQAPDTWTFELVAALERHGMLRYREFWFVLAKERPLLSHEVREIWALIVPEAVAEEMRNLPGLVALPGLDVLEELSRSLEADRVEFSFRLRIPSSRGSLDAADLRAIEARVKRQVEADLEGKGWSSVSVTVKAEQPIGSLRPVSTTLVKVASSLLEGFGVQRQLSALGAKFAEMPVEKVQVVQVTIHIAPLVGNYFGGGQEIADSSEAGSNLIDGDDTYRRKRKPRLP